MQKTSDNYPDIINNEKPALLAVRGRQKYSVRIASDDTECNIVSACILQDGTLVIADYNNKKLKHLAGYTYTIDDTVDLRKLPWQLCALPNREVAVSCPFANTIQIVSTEGKMVKSRKIKFRFQCWGLSYNDGTLYVSDYNKSMYMYTETGKKLGRFREDDVDLGCFSCIRGITVNHNNSVIYAANWEKGLIVLDTAGNITHHVKTSGDIDRITGLCLYGDGQSVLVCGSKTCNVIQLRADGTKIGEIIKTGHPCQTIVCDQNKSKLFVSYYKSDEIEIFEIE